MCDEQMLPQFARDLKASIDLLVNISQDNYQDTLINVLDSISSKIFSVKMVFELMGRMTIYKTKDFRIICDFLLEIAKKLKIHKLKAFIFTKTLENFLIEQGIIDGPHSNIPEYETNSLQTILATDNVQELITLSSMDENFNYDDKIYAIYNYFHYEKMSLIDTAAFFGSEECFKYLFANNAKTSIHTLKSAIIGGNIFIINTLEQNITGITNECLELAILTHSDNIADYFIDKYQLDYSYRSSLSTGNIYFFFKKYFNMGSNPNTLDSTKLNALQAATFFDFSSIVEYLIDNGGDINLEDNMRNTPLTISVFNNCELCADLLIKRGAQVDAKDMFGRTPLLIACISERENIVKLLIDNNADVNYMSEDHSTPICVAAERGNSKIIKYLLDNGANIELTDQFQNTPLIISVKNKHIEATKILLDYKANVNARNKNGMTSLHFVSKLGIEYNEIFDLLIKYKANPNIKNNGGDIPLKYARQVENSHIISILESMS